MSEPGSRDVGAREIASYEEERLSCNRRRCIRKAIAEVKSRAMASFAVSQVGTQRHPAMIVGKRNHFGFDRVQQLPQCENRFAAHSSSQYHQGFHQSWRADGDTGSSFHFRQQVLVAGFFQ